MALPIGSIAPDFTLPDETGTPRSLSEFLAKGPLVVVFYPGDFTPVCTKQLCSYRDAGEEFRNLGVQIIGISADPQEKHQDFKKRYRFDFPLLTDENKKVAKSFGATSKWMLGAVTRANFVLSKTGEVLFAHVDGIPVTHHQVTDLKDVLQQLRSAGKI